MHFYVYELRDETGTVFYIGAGSGDRMYQHTRPASLRGDTRKALRIREILARGGVITPFLLARFETRAEAHTEECRLIALHDRTLLTNSTSGGLGLNGLHAEVRAKLARAKRGKSRTQETRAKISAYQKGSAHPWARERALRNLTSSKMDFSGRKHTPETIAKMRAAKLGHIVSEETRRKISETKKRNRL
jgi:hypothetical protein